MKPILKYNFMGKLHKHHFKEVLSYNRLFQDIVLFHFQVKFTGYSLDLNGR